MSNDVFISPDTSTLPKSILVVEDDINLRFTLSEWLRICGYKVYEAATADEAVIVLASPILIDIVITDVDMPGSINGLGLVDHIKNNVAGVNIVVVSGKYPGHQISDKDIKFFQKPYDLQAVESHLVQMLGSKHE